VAPFTADSCKVGDDKPVLKIGVECLDVYADGAPHEQTHHRNEVAYLEGVAKAKHQKQHVKGDY
jgi:hypothetical protein